MAANRQRVGFVRLGPHPIPNRLLAHELAARPNLQVAVLDLEARLRADWRVLAANAPYVALEHGRQLALRRVRPWQAFFTTTYLFRRMSAVARAWVLANRFDWTIQIQSLFDARAPGVPHFVYTDHTHLANLRYADFDRRTLRSPRWIALERALYRGADAVFTRSAHISDSLAQDYGCEPGHAVCVGAGANVQVPDASEALPARTGQDILFVGVDWERKGGPELAEAFERVRARHPAATLTVVGCTPPLRGPGVRVVGRVPVEEVHRHYRDASVFCLPTRREPFGVAFVEALHHALPIVATRIGAVPDLVAHGENGYLVEVGDVASLAHHLDLVLADRGRGRAMGEAGARRARAGYTWSAVADRMLATVAGVTRSPSMSTHATEEMLLSSAAAARPAAIAH